MPLIRRRRVLAAKAETTTGTAESLTATEAAFNIYQSTIQPEIAFEQREGQGAALSPLPGVLGAYGGRCTFEIDLFGGASTPAWASTFLPACGLGESTGTFTPDSRPPEASGSNAHTLTIGVYEDGLFKQLHGCMGNCVFTFQAGQVMRAAFDFIGLWSDPSNVALLAPTYPTTAPLRFSSSALAIGSFSPKASQFTIDLGNDVQLREDPGTAEGYHSAVIVNRRINGTLDPESTLTGSHSSTVLDVYNDWLDRVERQLSLSVGSTGNQIDITIPKFQLANVQEADRRGLHIDTLTWQANRSASAGDDELSLAIS